MQMPNKTKILILGGGFGGLYTALELEKQVGDDPNIEITLVNRENFFLFTPMLHEVAASDLDITTIVNPIRKLLKRTNFFDGEVTSIDLDNRRVTVSHGIDASHAHELSYDHLVLALGSVTNFYDIPGLEEQALTMKSLADAVHLRNRLIEHLEEADFECSTIPPEQLLTFVVAGGGFAGVETIAAINDFLRDALEFYPHLTESMLRIVLVEHGSMILPELGPELGRYAQEKLEERKIEFRLGTKVTGLSERRVKLSNGTILPARTLIWTARHGALSNARTARLQERPRAYRRQRLSRSARLSRSLGLGRLCFYHRQENRLCLSADRAACPAPRTDLRAQYRRDNKGRN